MLEISQQSTEKVEKLKEALIPLIDFYKNVCPDKKAFVRMSMDDKRKGSTLVGDVCTAFNSLYVKDYAFLYEEKIIPMFWSDKFGQKHFKKTRSAWMPMPELLALQTQLVKILSWFVTSKTLPNAYGCVKGRNTVNAGELLASKAIVVQMDIKSFFPSITGIQLQRELHKCRALTNPVFSLVVGNKLLFKACYVPEGVAKFSGLPTGAPTSPILSNIFLRGFDASITKLLRTWKKDLPKTGEVNLESLAEVRLPSENIVYARYVDDITLASDYVGLKQIKHIIKRKLGKLGLTLNKSKYKVTVGSKQKKVLGMVINEKPGVQRSEREWLRNFLHRAIIAKKYEGVSKYHYFDKDGGECHFNPKTPEHPWAIIQGKIAYIEMVNVAHSNKLLERLTILKEVHELDPDQWSTETVNYGRNYKNNN